MTDQALEFSCAGTAMLGILSLPEQKRDTGVIIVVGGPQYRAGSHRQFVLLARQLAGAGFATLRFDQRGSGDSGGDQRSFEQLDDDIRAAIDALMEAQPHLRRVVLWGLCDAASAALLYCARREDSRVAGLCLLNPWARSVASLARTQIKHYYVRRLMQRGFWLKLLRGGVGGTALTDLLQNARAARGKTAAKLDGPFQDQMAHAWQGFAGPMLLVISGDDYTAKEFLDHARADGKWDGALQRANVQRFDLPESDHTFSSRAASSALERQCCTWLTAQFPNP